MIRCSITCPGTGVRWCTPVRYCMVVAVANRRKNTANFATVYTTVVCVSFTFLKHSAAKVHCSHDLFGNSVNDKAMLYKLNNMNCFKKNLMLEPNCTWRRSLRIDEFALFTSITPPVSREPISKIKTWGVKHYLSNKVNTKRIQTHFSISCQIHREFLPKTLFKYESQLINLSRNNA